MAAATQDHENQPLAGVPDPDEGSGPPRGSLAARLAEKRREIAKKRAPLMLVNVAALGNELTLVVGYPQAGYQPVMRAVERAKEGNDRDKEMWANADLICVATKAVLIRNENGLLCDLRNDSLIPVDEAGMPTGEPDTVRLGRELGEMLGIDVPDEIQRPARHVIRHLFSPRAEVTGVFDGDMALMSTGGKVYSWLSGEEKQISEDFSGE